MKSTSKKDLINLFIIFFLIILYIIGVNFQNRFYISFLIIMTMVLGISKLLKNSFEIKILIMFILQYLYCFLEYFIYKMQLSVYLEYNQYIYIYQVGMLNFLFTSIFFVSLKKINTRNFMIQKKENIILYYLNLSILLYLLLTGVSGKIGVYSDIKLTPKVEYSLIPYILINYYGTKKQLFMVNSFYFIFSIYLILIGSRVPAIQIIFTLLIFWRPTFLFEQKSNNILKNNKGILAIFAAILSMKLIEKIRNGRGTLLERTIEIFQQTTKSKIIVNNEADVIYASTALIGLIDNKILTFKESLESLVGIFFNFINIPIYEKMINLSKLVQNYTPMGGGGLTTGFLYYLGREPLVIVGAYFIGNTINKLYQNNKETTKVYSILVLVTIFRWYPYSLASLYKMSLYGMIWYFFNNKIHKVIIKFKK